MRLIVQIAAILAALFVCTFARCLGAEPLKIDGPATVEPYRLAVLAPNVRSSGAAYLWDVEPEDRADVMELDAGFVVMTGPPGEYRIKLVMIEAKDGKTITTTARHRLTIGTPKPPAPPQPPQPQKPTSMVPQCIGKLRVGSSGCTATPIYPRRPDGRWDVLTASHCTADVGTRGTLTLKDGRTFGMTVTARQRGSDLSWFVTDDPVEDMPYGVLAESDPAKGTPVWQAGYGLTTPTVPKHGFTIGPSSNGQYSFRLLVNSGDSGGPVFSSDTNEIVASVCCTHGLGEMTTMYGGSATTARRLRPGSALIPVAIDPEEAHEGCFHPVIVAPGLDSLLPPLRSER